MAWCKDNVVKIVVAAALINLCRSNKCTVSEFFLTKMETLPSIPMDILANCRLTNDNTIAIADDSGKAAANVRFHSKFAIFHLSADKMNNSKISAQGLEHRVTKYSYLTNQRKATNNFVIRVTDKTSLKCSLSSVKNSLFWNQNGNYVIEMVSSKNACQEVDQYLQIIWEFKILSVLFVCRDSKNRLNFYAFNPFTDKAPAIWTQHTSVAFAGDNKRSTLTLFKLRSLNSNDLSCESLFFAKDKDLGGYPIRMLELTSDKDLPYALHQYGLQVTRKIVTSVWSTLNASLIKHTYPVTKRGGFTRNGTPTDLLNDLLRGNYDMQLNLEYERFIYPNQVYTFIKTGICYIAQKQWVPLIGKHLTTIVSPITCLLMIGIVVLSVFILSRSLGIEYVTSLMDLLRGLLKMQMLYVPSPLSIKLFFFSLIFIFIAINCVLESRVLSLLVAPEKEILETSQDLVRLGRTIYAEHRYEQYFYNTSLDNYVRTIDSTKRCLDMMAKDWTIACTSDCWACRGFRSYDDVWQILSDHQHDRYFVYVFRDNFFLRRTYQKVYERFYEAGIVGHYQNIDIRSERMKDTLQYNTLKPVKLEQILLVFYLLWTGLFLSVSICLVEFFYATVRKTNVNQPVTGIDI